MDVSEKASDSAGPAALASNKEVEEVGMPHGARSTRGAAVLLALALVSAACGSHLSRRQILQADGGGAAGGGSRSTAASLGGDAGTSGSDGSVTGHAGTNGPSGGS